MTNHTELNDQPHETETQLGQPISVSDALGMMNEARRSIQAALDHAAKWLPLAVDASSCMSGVAGQLEDEMISEVTEEASAELLEGAEVLSTGMVRAAAGTNAALIQALGSIRRATASLYNLGIHP
jgi:hypothetical protein